MPKFLRGDLTRLKQVLINLTHNALKFTLKGRVDLFVAYDEGNEKLWVRIKDTGKGIANSEMGSLFDMFGKLNRTAPQNSAGLGMGLKVCKLCVEANGGRISVYSAGVKRGCEFKFSFKAKIEQSDDCLQAQ